MAILYQIFSILGFTIGNSLWAKPVKSLPISLIIAAKSAITSILFLCCYIFLQLTNNPINIPIDKFSIYDVLKAVGLCFLSFWGLYFFNKSLKNTVSGITITVTGMGTIIGFLAAVFIYHEKITALNIISSVLGALGLWCLEKLNPAFFRLKFSKGLFYAILSMIFWRIGILFPISINKIGIILFSLVLELTVFFTSVILFSCSKEVKSFKISNLKPNSLVILMIAISNFFGILGSHLALQATSAVNYTLLGFLYPITTFSISIFYHREKYSNIQYIGILIILFGGLCLNYLSLLFKIIW